MGLSNDERGWVMTSLSGVACVLGASVICVDIVVRLFPGKKNFRIQDSDSFLSASLSLSFGVMLFSSLFSMLPSSKSSLMDAGYDAKTATWIMMACFLGGYIGIQILSRILHKFIPSHVVDCEHRHDDDEHDAAKEGVNGHVHHESEPSPAGLPARPSVVRPRSQTKSSLPGHIPQSPLPTSGRKQSSYFSRRAATISSPTIDPEARQSWSQEPSTAASVKLSSQQRPSFHQRFTSRLSRLTSGRIEQCGSDGPCRGFSEICGTECFKNVNARGGTKLNANGSLNGSTRGTVRRTRSVVAFASETTPLLHSVSSGDVPGRGTANDPAARQDQDEANRAEFDTTHQTRSTVHNQAPGHDDDNYSHDVGDHEASFHHHHVPTNAFLSIGLQTSIAIALHKLPEGFITYATNHANPQLGVAVFLALFIHNITEGFAMALPLYLAINSRVKAMFWSFILGGLSQPLGAGVAALWFAVAGNGKWAPDEGIYGGMFAATAGIMVSVALQLFSEALDLTHSRTLCMVGAISGMTILGISSALTAK